jgi:cold shock CspA family protein
MMLTGTLTGPFNERGFTFIRGGHDANAGPDVFLHIRNLVEGQDSAHYVRGALVEFDLILVRVGGTEKPQARNVKLAATGAVSQATSELSRTNVRGRPKFWHANGYGFVVDEETQEEFYVPGTSVPHGYLRNGDEVEFDVEEQDDGRFQAINVRIIGWTPTQQPFDDQLDMGQPRWAEQLAALAEPEPWNYQISPAADAWTILRSYIKYTFLRLGELPDHVRVSADETQLAFNTGLVTSFQEQLFAVFRRRATEEVGPPWVLRSFERASNPSFLRMFGGDPPPLASYFDDPSDLVFDVRVPLSVNVEHVPHDPDRFPDALKYLSAEDLAGLVNAKAPEAIERVRRNYKTAIPQFYRDGKTGQGKMQLLLPVSLLRRDSVELALAVDRLGPEIYLGRTVLTLDWAYNNARLLTRPDTDWLRP